MKHVGIESKFYNLDTFKKEIDVNFIDLDSELVGLNYKVASLIFCPLWRSIVSLMLTADNCQPHSTTTTITFMCMTIITYSVAKMNDINNSTSSDKIHFLEKDMLGNVTEKFIFDFTQLLLRKLSLIREK